MIKIYTNQDINQFFQEFKNLPNFYSIEKVHLLINNPNAKAMQRTKLNHKLLNLSIMTSIIIIGISSLFFLLKPDFTLVDSKDEVSSIQKTIILPNEKDSIQKEIVSPDIELFKPEKINVNRTNTPTKNSYEKESSNSIVTSSIHSDTINNRIINYWPADSVISGEHFIITLSDPEAKNIGFQSNDTSLWYTHVSGRSISFNRKPSNEITSTSDFKFITITDDSYGPYPPNDPIGYSREIFATINDTLLPIIINSKRSGPPRIFWFTVTEDLFNCLPDRYHYLKSDFQRIINTKRTNGNIDLIKYGVGDVTESMNMVELTKTELQEFGFIIEDTCIHWPFFYSEIGCYYFTLTKKNPSVNLRAEIKNANHGIDLIILSDEFGRQNMRWSGKNQSYDEKSTVDYFKNNIQLLVPVLLKQVDFPEQLKENQIFWFEASDSLFNSLPDRISKQLKHEYKYITAETEEQRKNFSTNCTFFEECKSTLMLENFKLYPNPTTGLLNIEFNFPQSANGTISLTNIVGAQIKEMVPNTTFIEGNNSFSIDLSDIKPGIYLVYIKTATGFKTQRLVISR